MRERAAREVDRLAAVGGLPGDEHVVLRVDERGEPLADGRLIVGDEHADHPVAL